MQDKRQSSSSQYVNHAFQAEIHAQPSDDATSTVVTSGDHATKTKRAPFQRQESFSSTAANALISVASVTTNLHSPKIPEKSERNRDKVTTPAISSDSDEHSGYVSDLADFWREYKRR
ncbi:hypothetical protein LSAT2_000608 [Lamellibrachia satsuma]|nr:hypothetical protein LSAT2_000608 [Lamellibrachia satsuma]